MISKIEKGNMVYKKLTKNIQSSITLIGKVYNFLLPLLFAKYRSFKAVLDKNEELEKRLVYGLIFVVSLLFLLACGGLVYMVAVFTMLCVMAFELIKMVSKIEKSNNQMFVLLRRWGLLYIAFCCASLVLIRESEHGFKVSIWMFVTVWSVDTFAYIFGKKFGKLKLAPTVSPGKTYEGAILGSIAGLFVSITFYKAFATGDSASFSILSFAILSIIVVILAQLSDLSESYIKRQCKVKDSGNILPGHGGLMDRFDSFFIVAPFVFIVIWLNGGVLF